MLCYTAAVGTLSLLAAPFSRQPFALTLAATYKCQSRCKLCEIWKIKAKKELKAEEYLPLWQKFAGLVFLNITGGEPFLRPDLEKLIKIASQNLTKLSWITIATNGLDPTLIVSKVKKILSVYKGNLSIEISLDGEEKLHDSLRGIPGSYKKALLTLKQLQKLSQKEKRLHLSLSYTISPFNAGSLEQFSKHLEERGVNCSLSVNLAQNGLLYQKGQKIDWNNSARKMLKKDIAFLAKSRPKIISEPYQLGKNLFQRFYLKNLLTFLQNPRQIIPCQAGSSSFFLDPYGNLYPCITWNGKGKCPLCFTPCEAQIAFWKNLPFSLPKAF